MRWRVIKVYSDYKSPYAYLAKDPAYDLAREIVGRVLRQIGVRALVVAVDLDDAPPHDALLSCVRRKKKRMRTDAAQGRARAQPALRPLASLATAEERRRSRPCGARKSRSGPAGTIPDGLIVRW